MCFALRSELVTFLIWLVVRGRKTWKSICQRASPGPSTSRISRSLCDRSARRFAQDDGFVRGSRNIRLVVRKTRKVEKVTGSRDDVFVGVSKKNIRNKLALRGRSPFERFSPDARDTVPEKAVPTKVKAFENIVFGPCAPGRTWGTPPHRQPRSLRSRKSGFGAGFAKPSSHTL